MREYEVGVKREKLALDNFAEKYIINEKLEIIPIDYFGEKKSTRGGRQEKGRRYNLLDR